MALTLARRIYRNERHLAPMILARLPGEKMAEDALDNRFRAPENALVLSAMGILPEARGRSP
ncbi:MAG TPA: hypothetical protein DDY78_21195 [Planctomycetales bacterium]|jgi:hypothetical protein|nr:hypothetical protein [Planctomycetales bacterium]